MTLQIILVNYNSTELLIRCLDTLKDQSIPVDHQIVVVDNHSPDGGAERLRRERQDIELLENTANVGYAGAVNQAIRQSNSSYILLLNPDIEVKPGAISAMLNFMGTHSDAGIVGGKLLNSDGSLQYSCRTFYTLPVILLRRTFLGKLFPDSKRLAQHLMTDWDHNSVREVDWVLGACLMIRRSALKEIGLMDERFFLYFEDVDWCYRMKKGGWKVYYLPDAQMLHHHQRQSAKGLLNKTLLYHLMSLIHFYDKWGSLLFFLKRYRGFLKFLLFLLLDIAAVNLSFSGAHFIRNHVLIFLEKPPIPFFYYHKFLLFVNLVTPLVFYSSGLYTFKQGEVWVDELFRAAKGVLMNSLFLMAASYLVQGYEFSRSIVLVFAVLSVCSIFILRWGAFSYYTSWYKKGFNLRRTLIIGTGKSAAVVQNVFQKHYALGFDIVGFIHSDHTQQEDASPDAIFPILGSLHDLPRLIREQNISELIITNSSDSQELISRGRQSGVNVRLLTDFHSLRLHESVFEELAGIPTILFKGSPLFGFNLALKRMMDIVLSLIGLIVLSPFLSVIAALIKLESSGPVLFRQTRIGRDRQPFTMFKFRSMCDNADAIKGQLTHYNEAQGPIFKIQNDPRRTRLGRFLRKFSLDELPQLWNVLKGEMSLVGPRPPLPSEVNEYDEWAFKRLEVKPGISGLWQVSGRSDLTFDEMLKLDVYYIWNWSLSDDLKILLRTIPVVISGKGAY